MENNDKIPENRKPNRRLQINSEPGRVRSQNPSKQSLNSSPLIPEYRILCSDTVSCHQRRNSESLMFTPSIDYASIRKEWRTILKGMRSLRHGLIYKSKSESFTN